MAKSKKSRRARRLEAEKQKQTQPVGNVAGTPQANTNLDTLPIPTETVEKISSSKVHRNSVNFAQEYFHVYIELRNVLLIAAIMFVIMVGALYLI